MIYTVTLNPSIDYIMEVEEMDIGKTNRSTNELFYLGGKGINVSIVLNALNLKTTALGFLGGFSGQYIETMLKDYPLIHPCFVQVNEPSRINVKLKGQKETEINGSGPIITNKQNEALKKQINELKDASCVVLAGSKAQALEHNWYELVASQLYQKGIPFVVDIASKDLISLLTYQPILIKPNVDELEALFDLPCHHEQTMIELALKLHHMGAKHVVVSQGKDGALMVCQEGIFKAKNPPGTLVNSVGAGDSLVAGFVAGYQLYQDAVQAFSLGVACGSATAYSSHLATKEMIELLQSHVEIEKIKGAL